MEGQTNLGNYQQLYNTNVHGIQVQKFKSKVTGLSVVVVDVPGPLVSGYFVLSTEAHDDDGCPHTLEHLVFLGSELYPYKGVLDSAANRCFAQGTNAWTATDHTCYTISTAGQEGFLQLLPVYVDHILYPTLTDSGCYTEVHHVTGEGENAGVVYCEMQGRENNDISLSHVKLLHSIFPENSGYHSETGGKMLNLRSLSVDTIRNYHKSYYRPDNLCLIIAGKVDVNDLFKVLDPVEKRIEGKGKLPTYVRPWSDLKLNVPAFTKSEDHSVPFPSDDEASGTVYVGLRSCPFNDFETRAALIILEHYLTESAVSPLRKTFVDIPEPLANRVSISTYEWALGLQIVTFSNVPTEQLANIKQKFFDVLRKIVDEGFDMERIATVMHLVEIKYLNELEESAHYTFANYLITDFLYGNNEHDFQKSVNPISDFPELKKKDNAYWVNLLKKYFLDQPHVVIRGTPSKEAASKLHGEEETRLEAQKKKLGEEKLKELGEHLEKAVESNDIEVPLELIAQFKVPDVKKVPLIPIVSVRYGDVGSSQNEKAAALMKRLDTDVPEAPNCFLQIDNVPSNFVEFNMYIDTGSLSDNFRPYLELFAEIIFDLPVHRDGKLIPHEVVVNELTKDTISYNNDIGFGGTNFVCGSFAQFLYLHMKCETSKYLTVVRWFREFLWHSEFNEERLKIGAQKLISDVSQQKREGNKMVAALLKDTIYDKIKSNHGARNLVRQQKVLETITSRLESDPKAMLAEFNEFRNVLVNPSNIRVQVSCAVDKVAKVKAPWTNNNFVPSSYGNKQFYPTKPVVLSQNLLSTEACSGQSLIAPLAAIQSAFLVMTAPGPKDWNHKDVAPCRVLLEYLTALEGPFWKQIRGLGLSYGYDLRLAIEEGVLYFKLYRSVNPSKAFAQSKAIVDSFLKGEVLIEEEILESAKSSLIYAILQKEKTVAAAAFSSFVAYLTGQTSQEQLESVQKVTKEDALRVLRDLISQVFDIKKTTLAITISPQKLEETLTGFTELGRKLDEIASLEDHFLSTSKQA